MRNTDRRLAEVCAMIEAILFAGTLTLKQAQVARGRHSFRLHVSDCLRSKLVVLKERLVNAKPRCISTDMASSWSLYTHA